MVSNLLYQHRFGGYLTEPLIAGLDPVTNKPYICAMDTIGCIAAPNDFVAVGTGTEYLLGVCEGKFSFSFVLWASKYMSTCILLKYIMGLLGSMFSAE